MSQHNSTARVPFANQPVDAAFIEAMNTLDEQDTLDTITALRRHLFEAQEEITTLRRQLAEAQARLTAAPPPVDWQARAVWQATAFDVVNKVRARIDGAVPMELMDGIADALAAAYADGQARALDAEEAAVMEAVMRARAEAERDRLRTALDWAANCVEGALDYYRYGNAQAGMEANHPHFEACLANARGLLATLPTPPAAGDGAENGERE